MTAAVQCCTDPVSLPFCERYFVVELYWTMGQPWLMIVDISLTTNWGPAGDGSPQHAKQPCAPVGGCWGAQGKLPGLSIAYDFMISWSESFVFILAHTLDISWLHTVALSCLSSAGQQATESDALGFGEARHLERERSFRTLCNCCYNNYKSLGWPNTASVRQFTLPLTCCAIMMKLLHWAGMRYGMQPEQLSRFCTRE